MCLMSTLYSQKENVSIKGDDLFLKKIYFLKLQILIASRIPRGKYTSKKSE